MGLEHARALVVEQAAAQLGHDAGRVRVTDVLVLGAGLAGLAAARDLAQAGADVLLLEARERPGGRVERAELDDGRAVQMGGELIGDFHTAYLGLAAEFGLEPEPSYVAEPGAMSWDLAEGPARATTRRSSRPPTSPTPSGRGARRAARGDRRPRRPVGPSRRRRARRPLVCGLAAGGGRPPRVVRLHDLGALSMGGG